MKEWLAKVPVRAEGTQTFIVSAETEEEAIERVNQDEGERCAEDLYVTHFDHHGITAEENK